MQRPSDQKRKTPPVEGGAFQIDCNSSKIERPEYSQPHQENQPIAIARNFGFCFGVFIRQGGSERRAGLFDNIANAENAARRLNRQFQIDAAAS